MIKKLQFVYVLVTVCALSLHGKAQTATNQPAAKSNSGSGLTRCTTPAPREGPMRRLLADLLAVGGLDIEPLTKLERAVALIDRVSA